MAESHSPGKTGRSVRAPERLNRERVPDSDLRRWIPRRAKLGFSRGSVFCKRGLHHVACILVQTVDDGLFDWVAEPSIKAQPVAVLSVLPRLEGLEDRKLLSTFMVTNLNDSGGHSLRAGIQSGDATIAFAPGLHGTITLKSALPITGGVTINGPGANKISVSGNDTYQVLDISGSASVSIAGLTITEGLANSGGGILLQGSAALNVSNCMLSDNEALGNSAGGGFGGGIEDESSGALNVADSTFANNMAIGVGANNPRHSRLHPRTGWWHRRFFQQRRIGHDQS